MKQRYQNRKHKIGQNYKANYSFLSPGGNLVSISTTIRGLDIIKYGMKSCVRHNATRLNIPKGYTCSVDD